MTPPSPPSPPPSASSSSAPLSRNTLIERCSSYRGCEPCKRRKRVCNGKRPCTHCVEAQLDCVYSVVSDHSRSVFTTNSARRLSSGSACETCRRRKTKCDGGSPCAFCASAGIECVNNSERRKRTSIANTSSAAATLAVAAAAAAASAPSPSSSPPSSSSSSSSSKAISATHSPTNGHNPSSAHQMSTSPEGGSDAMDRIEDRLRRIEKLMTAFTPSPLSQSTSFNTDGSTRKLSTPHSPHHYHHHHHHHQQYPAAAAVRQHRHSVQGINVAKEQAAALRSVMMIAAAKDGIGMSSSNSSMSSNSSEKSSPPLSPVPRQSASTQPITSSMLNLSLSPSSSTSSNSSSMLIRSASPPLPPPAATAAAAASPTPPADTLWLNSTHMNANTTKRKSICAGNEWKVSSPIPSLMDQLSKRTFATTALDYSTMQYPIYPISQPTTPTSPNMSDALSPP